MENITNLDVTVLEPRQKHPTIFARYDDLAPGASLIIYNDHDPKPLYYQLLGERGNNFNWEYLEQGPEWWRVKITKHGANTEPTVGELAAADYRKAQVFKKFGLDFCCGGKKTVEEACAEKNISATQVLSELKLAEEQQFNRQYNYNEWDPAFLSDFIENNHHAYVKKSLQPVLELAVKVARVHGEAHPETKSVVASFNRVAQEMSSHMAKEEQVLFPYIHKLVQEKKTGVKEAASFGSVKQPINMMEMEHDVVGKNMGYINQLTNGYTLPADACASYTLLYKWLKEFEDDLLQHVHLENNILFPKAIDLEKQLS
jgi:regulator of cell morphogenesis and NO signaling